MLYVLKYVLRSNTNADVTKPFQPACSILSYRICSKSHNILTKQKFLTGLRIPTVTFEGWFKNDCTHNCTFERKAYILESRFLT